MRSWLLLCRSAWESCGIVFEALDLDFMSRQLASPIFPPLARPILPHPHPPSAAGKAADCCEDALADGHPSLAAAAALAALSLASCLRFGGPQSAAPYAEAAVRCKQALKAAYDAGAAVTQEVREAA